ncbi:MAG: SHOCT domain-containing protein [Candidatus Moranbacteria bacterium]|jgi:putative membrane protein|nr:SHOCT domain-containing protein [Candidatus Moranbacteria bacterium]
MMGNFYNMGWGGGLSFGFGWIFMLLFWGLIVWAIIVLAKNLANGNCCGTKQNKDGQNEGNAINILKERYAKGELSKEDFDRMKNDLQ